MKEGEKEAHEKRKERARERKPVWNETLATNMNGHSCVREFLPRARMRVRGVWAQLKGGQGV